MSPLNNLPTKQPSNTFRKVKKCSLYPFDHISHNIQSGMAALDDEIAALKAVIEGYELELKDATSREEKSELRGLIKSCRDNLTELLKLKIASLARAEVVAVGESEGIYDLLMINLIIS